MRQRAGNNDGGRGWLPVCVWISRLLSKGQVGLQAVAYAETRFWDAGVYDTRCKVGSVLPLR